MSIWAYVGLPGGGKSYHAVADQILPALRQGRTVVTNIPLNVEALRAAGAVGEVTALDNDALARDPGEIITKTMVPGSVIVLDELWRFLPAGKMAKDVPQEWKSLFAEHRHRVDELDRSMQIVLVTQDLGQVAAFARALVERTVIVTKMTVVGSAKRYRVDVYAGSVTGLKPPIGRRIAEQFGTYDPAIFECYQSHTMAQGAVGKVDESVISDRGSVWRHPAVRFGLPIAAGLMIWGLWRAMKFFFPDAPELADPVVQPSSMIVRSATRFVVADRKERMRYRVSAIIRGSDDSATLVLIDHCDGTPGRWIPWIAARCIDESAGGVMCEWRGQKYEFHGAIDECRQTDERRSAEIQWFPANAGGSRESVSPVGSALDGTGR